MFVYYASPSFFLRTSQYSQRIFAKKAVLIDELVKMKTGLKLNMLCYSLHASTGVKHNFWQDYKRLHHMEHSLSRSLFYVNLIFWYQKIDFLISENTVKWFFLNIRLLYFDIQNSIFLKDYIRKWFLIIYYSNFELQKHVIFSYASVPSSKLWWLFLCKVVQL